MCNEYAREIEMARIIAYMEEMKDVPPFEYMEGRIPNDIGPKKSIRIRDTSIVVALKDKSGVMIANGLGSHQIGALSIGRSRNSNGQRFAVVALTFDDEAAVILKKAL